jgi:hypothetical protein
VLSRVRAYLFPHRSVLQDWIGALPPRQMQTFRTLRQQWDSAYAMGSVALEGSFELRDDGNDRCAAEQAKIAGELLARLADDLISACKIMEDEARHFADIPAVEPLDPSNFRTPSIIWPISVSRILHQVAFGARNRFFHKVRTLERTVEALADEFTHALELVVERETSSTDELWDALERLHDDLNTCLRESEVVLKSFLRALSPEVALPVLARLEAPADRRARTAARRRIAVSA